MQVEQLNFHHLRYFWAVARDGTLTRTAARLRVAQSALSSQIHQLEEQLGERLFAREGRRLVLTEAGRIAFAFAEDIFAAGSELVSTLDGGRARAATVRIGTVSTLSRNFQESFVRPLLDEPDVRLSLASGVLDELLVHLEHHRLDLVLSNRRPPHDPAHRFRCRRIARQPVSIVGRQRHRGFRFPEDVDGEPMILPSPSSDVRSEFDALTAQLGARVEVRAEVDDMATIRLLARDTSWLALVPTVVVRDELREGLLFEHCVVPGLNETFYAISVARSFPHPLLKPLLARGEAELLSMVQPAAATPKPERARKPGPKPKSTPKRR